MAAAAPRTRFGSVGPSESQPCADRQPGRGHRGAVAAQPLGGGVDARLVADEADPAVAVRDASYRT